jgi:hypothetical protein
MNGKEYGREPLWLNLKRFPDICLERLSKTTGNLVRIVGVAAEFRTEHLLSTTRKSY